MIEVKDIHKSFDDHEVLKGISGTFEQGQTSMVIGSSGTGKSVLLKCMIGILKPNRGNVYFNGRDIVSSVPDLVREIRKEMGVLFQGGALFDSKSVLENVKFPLDVLTDQPEEEKIDRAMTCLKRVQLEDAAHQMPSEISGGMKKRVGIARAIVMNPKYLFCDEPNSGLDPLTSTKIDYLIQEITKEYNITTVVISHDMNSVIRMGEKVLFLSEGEKLWEGSSQEIRGSGIQALDEFVFSKLT